MLNLSVVLPLPCSVLCRQVASQAVGAMPSLIFFPILPFIFEVGLVIYWVAVTGAPTSTPFLRPCFHTCHLPPQYPHLHCGSLNSHFLNPPPPLAYYAYPLSPYPCTPQTQCVCSRSPALLRGRPDRQLPLHRRRHLRLHHLLRPA